MLRGRWADIVFCWIDIDVMYKLTRREFIRLGLLLSGGLYCTRYLGFRAFAGNSDKPWRWSREAMFYTQTSRGVKCGICPNECTIRNGETSQCHNRVNYNGKLFSIAYGNPCAVHVDPVEKKPLYHFLPNSLAYSIATAGCNFGCLNCQNWEISQSGPKDTKNVELFPEKAVEQCLQNGCKSIAYTYSEPTTFYEYMYDTARVAHQQGVKNILVSNGYINDEPLKELSKYIDAANIDLKSFSNDIYLKLNAGTLQPVLNTLKTLNGMGVWVEITNLVVPSWTDDFDMIKRMCDWLASNGLSAMPIHFSRFFPLYKLTQLPQTPLSTLAKARDIAIKSGLKYAYIGNTALPNVSNTYCPECSRLVVERKGFSILTMQVRNGKCNFCGAKVHGYWE